MKGSPALICIPDITGFTEFMSEAKLDSSKTIIPSLLNKIIYANKIGLKVSEIEGDAVLFFKNGELPKLEDIISQCKKFFEDFHLKIGEFAEENKGKKDFTQLTNKLGLKIVMHYGEVEIVKVGTHLKLIGEDMIIAHRLLKNDIKFEEYVVFTKELMDNYSEEDKIKNGINEVVKEGSEKYQHIGNQSYYYINAEQINLLN